MPVKKTTRKTTKDIKEVEDMFADDVPADDATAKAGRRRAATVKAAHVEPGEIVAALNEAVSSINVVFQMRDQLMAQVDALKEELKIGGDMRIEQARLDDLRRRQDNYTYDYETRKKRLEEELETREKEHVARLKMERQDHERMLKLEREDFDNERKSFEGERAAFEKRAKEFEQERQKMKERLVEELDRDNAHQMKVVSLNHQNEIEQLKGSLKLQEAHGMKYETLLTEARTQNDKLAEQLSTLSREALASASSSTMASKLQEIVSKMSATGPSGRIGS